MPKRTDIHTILIIGSGPIVIGQGCEFDYSGTQACKALRAEGYRVVLVNSNPATIMTDPEFSDRTYIEPITPESVRKIIEKQIEIGDPIDAVLPTLGGQTALNCACALWDDGTFQKYGINMIGADRKAIHRAEDRQAFKELCEGLGLKMARARTVTTLDQAREFLNDIGLPAIIRPAFTLGGSGGGVAYNTEEFDEIVTRGLRMSMIGQILIDQSLLGWKEYELEVVRDKKDNCIVVCGIENIDPMGVHTGDSITIAPILTLTDKEYQAMRDAAFAIMRAVGVETGGSNVQFAVNPSPVPDASGKKPFEMVVIEMNPRVSRSSALASKATGFPIAKIAAKLAVGYTLDELKNDITGTTSACFEPTIDYIVTKMPRWTFEKFPEADETLTTQMKSVGEAMAIGRTFLESFQKAIRSMEVKRFGLGLDKNDKWLAAMRAVEKQQLVLDVMGSPTLRVGSPSSELGSPTLRVGSSSSPTLRVGSTSADFSILDQIDANPAIASRPAEFIGRDPYPTDMYGAVPDLLKSQRKLPHLQLAGATYFVTWRCEPGVTLSEAERQHVMNALRHFDGDRCRVYAACVMPDHVHWIVRPHDGVDLLELRESVKRLAATQINLDRGRTGRLWEPEAFDHIIRNTDYFAQFMAYVVRNPKEQGLVKRAGAYPFTFVHELAVKRSAPQSETGATQAPHSESGATQPSGATRGTSPTGLRTADGAPIEWPIEIEKLTRKLAVPSQGRMYYIRYAMKMGWSLKRINELSKIDFFFLDQIKRLVEFEDVLCSYATLDAVPREVMFQAKQMGYSDAQLANLYLGDIKPDTILKVRARRKQLEIEPVYKLVDTCAAEFEAVTPYYYSTYETSSGGAGFQPAQAHADDEIRVTDKKKVIILGGGPNRIGQGIEFDYCCVHAAFAAKELGFEAVMINSNPETVSTDYDTSDLLFFEPLTLEDVLNVVERLSGPSFVFVDEVFPSEKPFALDHALRTEIGEAIARVGYSRGVVLALGGKSSPEGFIPGDGLVLVDKEKALGILKTNGVWVACDEPVSEDFFWDQVDSDDQVNCAEQWLQGASLVHGLIVQFGGQTPLNLAHGLQQAGAPIIGTSVDSIDLAEDRDRFDALLTKLNLQKPPSGIARNLEQAVAIASRITYPVLVRPSYVLGGRGMEICSDEKSLRHYMSTAVNISELDNAPVLIDKFLDDATEVDVDVVADYAPSTPSMSGSINPSTPSSIICGVMEHIEQAGIHSGDSACTIPQWSLAAATVDRIKQIGRELARELRVNGLMNVQMAIKQGVPHSESGATQGVAQDQIYILEVNPRASRTAPFVGKATHRQWPRIAAKVMMGKSLTELGAKEVDLRNAGYYAVKESVFPFGKFPGVDVVLGPEMRSTGEVMGIDTSLPIAFAKSQIAAGINLPKAGNVFLSVRERDRAYMVEPARLLASMGFGIFATDGTGTYLAEHGVPNTILQKIGSGARPNVIDMMSDGKIQLVINTPTKTGWQTDEGRIRAATVRLGVPMITTTTGALAAARAIKALREGDWGVRAMQDYLAGTAPSKR